jgi:hypothetical protein
MGVRGSGCCALSLFCSTIPWLSKTRPAQIFKIAPLTMLAVTRLLVTRSPSIILLRSFKSVIVPVVRTLRLIDFLFILIQVGLISLQGGVLVPKRRPPLKKCPSPTSLFTGRSDVLQQLHRCFAPFPTSVESMQQRRFVLHGLGGGGKTQIAYKFVKECQIETQPRRCV